MKKRMHSRTALYKVLAKRDEQKEENAVKTPAVRSVELAEDALTNPDNFVTRDVELKDVQTRACTGTTTTKNAHANFAQCFDLLLLHVRSQ